MTDIMLVTPESFSLTAQETIRELTDGDCLLLRVAVKGPHFPHRDSVPFVRIVSAEGATVEALIAVVSIDQKELRGYFPVDTEVAGRVEFGYAGQLMGSVPVMGVEPARLDAKRVGTKVHRVTRKDPGPLGAGAHIGTS